MRSFTIMTALVAAGSLAQPLNEKRAIVYVTETDVTYETVWISPNAAAATPAPERQAPAIPVPVPEIAVPTPAAAPQATPHGHAVAHQAAPAAPAAPVAQAPAPIAPVPINVALSTGGNDFQSTCVNSHNTLRAQHNVGKLSWDDDLAASAQALANECVFHHDTTLGPASSYGQNIAMSWGTAGMHDKTAEAKSVIVNSWYTGEAQKFAELNLYGVANPLDNDFEAWGHFSQQVWKDTTKVGCAVQTCDNGYFTVCNYNPAGNFAGEFASNVFN